MKKLPVLIPALIILLVSCSEDVDPGGLNADSTLAVSRGQITRAPSPDEVDAVRLVTLGGYTLALSPWNDGFKLYFPENVPASQLTDIAGSYRTGAADGVECSDPAARFCPGWIEGYKDECYVSDFYLATTVGSAECRVSYLYSDRKVKVTGSVTADDGTTHRFDLSLFSRWNSVAVHRSEDADGTRYLYTSTIPAEVGWVFSR